MTGAASNVTPRTARQIAAQAVNAVLLEGRSLSEVFADVPPGRERAGAQDLSYGTLRQAGVLRFYLEQLVHRPLKPATLLGPLLVGLYELEFSRTPPHAAVHSTVSAVAALAPAARGLANALLRQFLRQRDVMRNAARTDPTAGNLPDWWLRRLQADWPEHWPAIVAAQDLHPPMTLRVNTRQVTLAEYARALADLGMEYEHTGECALTLKTPCPVSNLPGFAAGQVSVQDLGAQAAASALAVQPGMRVLDACAAPGGKTAHLLETAAVEVVALDSDARRLQRVTDTLARLDLRATCGVADAALPETWWDGQRFDRILLDAPCSGSGVVRRHPDARWLKREADVTQLAKLQARLLDALWPLLRPGGKLLYVTCSVFRRENHAQVARFLARHPDARREPLEHPGAFDGQWLPMAQHDGFFYARFVKH